MTRAQLRTALDRRLGTRGLPDADLDFWLDAGLVDLTTSRIHIPTLEEEGSTVPSVVGVFKYARPASAFAILYIEQTDSSDTSRNRQLRRWPKSFESFNEMRIRATTNSTDTPFWFTEFGDFFLVHPTPQVATLTWVPYIYTRPTWDSGPTAEPDLQPEWHYATLIVAAEHAFRDSNDEERAIAARDELNQWFARRDTARRMSARFHVPTHGIQMHPSLRDRRTGV